MQWMFAGERGRKNIKPYPTTRPDKPGRRGIEDLVRRKPAQSPEPNKCIIVRDDCSRFTEVYILCSKDDTAEYFMKYLVGIAPRKVVIVRSDEKGRSKVRLVPCALEKRLSRSSQLQIPLI